MITITQNTNFHGYRNAGAVKPLKQVEKAPKLTMTQVKKNIRENKIGLIAALIIPMTIASVCLFAILGIPNKNQKTSQKKDINEIAVETYLKTDSDEMSREKTMRVIFGSFKQKFDLSPEDVTKLQTDYLTNKTCSINAVKTFGTDSASKFTPTIDYYKALETFNRIRK